MLRLLGLVVLGLSWSQGALAERFVPARADAVPDEWQVVLRAEGHAGRGVERAAAALLGPHGLRPLELWQHAVHGFVVRGPEAAARALARHPWVESVFQSTMLAAPISDCSEGVVSDARPLGSGSPQAITCDDPDPQNPSGTCVDNWGLDRVDQRAATRDGQYAFGAATGAGVHIYLVDTGIYAAHRELAGRVGKSWDLGGDAAVVDDCTSWSHGTHVAGIAAGTTYGVAKQATLHVARITDCAGGLSLSSLVTALDRIYAYHDKASMGPAVVSMSLNGASTDFTAPDAALAIATQRLISERGLFVVESAGNQYADACAYVIGAPDLFVVGGVDELDTRWERAPGDPGYSGWCQGGGDCGSNVGACVDLFAPAAHIVSSFRTAAGDTSASCRLSGTSMAAPHVAGLAALYLQAHPTATPAEVRAALLAQAVPDVLSELGAGSPNLLASIAPADVVEPEPAPAVVRVTPAGPLDLGTLLVGDAIDTAPITVRNVGEAGLEVTSVSIAGAAAADFELVSDTCSAESLAAAGACEVVVRFAPLVQGSRAARLEIESNDAATPLVAVQLRGTGRYPQLVIALSGAGGSVVSDPAGVSCPGACSAAFETGSSVALEVSLDDGARVAAWSYAGCGTALRCVVALDDDLNVAVQLAGAGGDGSPGTPTDEAPAVQSALACSAGAGGELAGLIALLVWRRRRRPSGR